MQIKSSFAIYVINTILPLITFPYVSRVIGPEYYSIVAYSSAICAIFALILDFGMGIYGTKEIISMNDDVDKESKQISNFISSKLLILLFALPILVTIVHFLNNQSLIFVIYSGFAIFLYSIIPDYYYRAKNKTHIILLRIIIAGIINILLLFWFVKDGEDYLNLAIINVLCALVSFFFVFWDLKKSNYCICINNLMCVLRYIFAARHFGLSRIFYSIIAFTPIIIFEHISKNKVEVGLFSVALFLINSFKSISTPYIDAIYPAVIRSDNKVEINNLVIKILTLSFIAVIILWLFSEQIILILAGPSYIGSNNYFFILLPILLFSPVMYFLGYPALTLVNKTSWANYSVYISLVFYLFATLVTIILDLGIYFFIVSYVFSEFVILIVRVIVFSRALRAV